MSKSLKNYPDPSGIFEEMGADALRAFLINSPVLRAEPLRFSSDGVAEVVRTVLLPMWNTYSFFTTYAEADGITTSDLAAAPPPGDRPEMDRWILSVLQSLVAEVNEQMEGYYLYNVVPPTLGFIDHLTNWYVRRSRRRFWRARGESGEGDADKLAAFATLYQVLTTFIEVLAPVLPFITEHLYQDLVARHHPDAPTSVHHRDFPDADAALIDAGLERAMEVVREVVRLGRNLRKREGHRVRQPLSRLTVLTRDPGVRAAVANHVAVISEELNVKEVVASADEAEMVTLSAKANFRILGQVLGSRMPDVAAGIAALGQDELETLLGGGTVTVAGHQLTQDEVLVIRTPREGTVVETGIDLAVVLDTRVTDDLLLEGLAREIMSRAQRMRRDAGLDVTDRIEMEWWSEDHEVRAAFAAHHGLMATELLASSISESDSPLPGLIDLGDREVAIEISPVNAGRGR
jgi:isoleucyl-tRNA synthetase